MPSPAVSLPEELDALQKLQALLQLEQAALVEGSVDALSELIGTKSRLVADITILADARQTRLGDMGLEASEDGMQSWIDSSADASEKDVWSALLALAETVKEQNRLNGLVINQHLASTQQMLKLFENKVSGANFYGPDGQSSLKVNTRKFGSV